MLALLLLSTVGRHARPVYAEVYGASVEWWTAHIEHSIALVDTTVDSGTSNEHTERDADEAKATSLLRSVRVDIVSHIAAGEDGTKVLPCVRAVVGWAALESVQRLALSIETNGALRMVRVLGGVQWPVRRLPGGLRAEVVQHNLSGVSPLLLSHAHLYAWRQLLERTDAVPSSFVYLEDDHPIDAAGLRFWAEDSALLVRAGAAAAGFSRGFFRYEVDLTSTSDARRDGTYGDRFIQITSKGYSWDAAMANLTLAHLYNTSRRCVGVRDLLARCGVPRETAGWSYCAQEPLVILHHRGDGSVRGRGNGSSPSRSTPHHASSATVSSVLHQLRVFRSAPYVGMSALTRRDLHEYFSWHGQTVANGSVARGWTQTRYKSLNTREAAAIGYYYRDDRFIGLPTPPHRPRAPLVGMWAAPDPEARQRTPPRVLIPLAHDSGRWARDEVAGVHHTSNKYLNKFLAIKPNGRLDDRLDGSRGTGTSGRNATSAGKPETPPTKAHGFVRLRDTTGATTIFSDQTAATASQGGKHGGTNGSIFSPKRKRLEDVELCASW